MVALTSEVSIDFATTLLLPSDKSIVNSSRKVSIKNPESIVSQQWDVSNKSCATTMSNDSSLNKKTDFSKLSPRPAETVLLKFVVSAQDSSENSDLKPLIKKRDRPKGSNLNAIGLQKKRKVNFCEKIVIMSNFEKGNIMLEWLVPMQVIKQKVLGTDKITAKDLTNDLCCWFYNEEVDVNVLSMF